MTPERTIAQQWERVCRVLLCVIVGFIAVNALLALKGNGFNISTGLADMVPSGDTTAAQKLALGAAQESAEQSIILVLEASDLDVLQQAASFVDEELATMSEQMLRQDPEKTLNLVTSSLTSYRFQLLSPSDRRVLGDGDAESILERSIADLYSPGSSLKLLPLGQDPFNLFGRYVENSIGKLAMASQADEPSNTIAGTSADTSADSVTDTLPGTSQGTSQGTSPDTSPDTSTDSSASASGSQVLHEIINLRLLSSASELADQESLVEFFGHLDEVVDARYPQVSLLRTGVLFYSSEAAADAKKDINMISIGSIAGASVLMLLVFRSIRPLLTAAASIVLGVGFAFSVVHLLYGSIHVFTIVFGASLIGIVLDYTIHYYYHRVAHIDPARAKDNRQLYRALFVSLITSVAGFGALLFSNVAILQTIAVFSICGITAAWLTVLAFSPEKSIGRVKVRQHLIDAIASAISKAGLSIADRLNGRLAFTGIMVLLLVVVVFGKGQDDPRRFVHLSADLLQQGVRISNITNEIEPGRFFIVEADNEQQLFDRLETLYSNTGDLAQLISVFDWLPSPQSQKLNYQLQKPLFENDGPASKFFEATGMALEDLTALQREYAESSAKSLSSGNLVDLLEGQIPHMVVSTQDQEGQPVSLAAFVLMATGADIDDLKTRTSDLAGTSYVDTVADSTTELRKQRISSMWLLVLAYAVVGALMWVLYRDRRALAMTAVPAVSTVLTLCVLLLMGQPLTLFHTMSLFLILGLGMDYVVFLNEMKSDEKITQQAIVLSALTSMLSFGLLALSSVPVAQAFGLTVLIGNSFNLLATLAISKSAIWQRSTGRLAEAPEQ